MKQRVNYVRRYEKPKNSNAVREMIDWMQPFGATNVHVEGNVVFATWPTEEHEDKYDRARNRIIAYYCSMGIKVKPKYPQPKIMRHDWLKPITRTLDYSEWSVSLLDEHGEVVKQYAPGTKMYKTIEEAEAVYEKLREEYDIYE